MKTCKPCVELLFNVINFSVNPIDSIVSPFYKGYNYFYK